MPLTWTDCLDRTWPCKIVLGHADDIKDATGIDLLAITENDGAVYKQIVGDIATFSNVMYQLAKLNGGANFTATPKEFKAGIDGKAIDRMEVAFREALTDFFPAEKRELLAEAWELEATYRKKMVERAKQTIRNTNVDAIVAGNGAKMDQAMQAAVHASGSSSTKSPDESLATQSP
ncbi:MAG TPA: hypothetical protein VFE62_01635 [Gemmataceae bacterium]|nr:hypothetical protein [Gemmataceae bacterium]